MIAIGVDIVQIERFNKSLEANEKFANKILTQSELDVFKSRTIKNVKNGQHYLAKRFAAKEAVSKALGTGIAKGVTFKDIEILNDEFGAPYVTLFDQALKVFESKKAETILISISDEVEFAVAYVTLS